MSGSIINLVMELKGYTFIQALEHICYYCGYNFDLPKEKPPDNLLWLKKIKNKRKKNNSVIPQNQVLPESLLNQFKKLPHILFYQDGIDVETQKEFEIAYDINNERIVFPLRNKDGELVGIKGRSVIDDENIPKYYIYYQNPEYTPRYPLRTDLELFNLHRALPHIIKKQEIIVGEAEKFPMQLYKKYKNVVALGCSSLTFYQRKILQELVFKYNIRIIFAFDKGLDLKKAMNQEEIQMLKTYCPVYYIDTNTDLLKDKESPADRGIGVFENLLDNITII